MHILICEALNYIYFIIGILILGHMVLLLISKETSNVKVYNNYMHDRNTYPQGGKLLQNQSSENTELSVQFCV